MRTLHVNGYDMAYAEHGTGATLVLIHGSLLDHRYWAPQMDPLGQHHRVVAPSLRHCWPARWDGAGDDFTIRQHVDDVAALIDALGAGPVHLLGHSRGGHIAFRVPNIIPTGCAPWCWRTRAGLSTRRCGPPPRPPPLTPPRKGCRSPRRPPGPPISSAVATPRAAWPSSSMP